MGAATPAGALNSAFDLAVEIAQFDAKNRPFAFNSEKRAAVPATNFAISHLSHEDEILSRSGQKAGREPVMLKPYAVTATAMIRTPRSNPFRGRAVAT